MLVTLQRDEMINTVSVFAKSDLYFEYSDLPGSEFENFLNGLRVSDSVHACIYNKEDKTLVVVMKQFFIDNPSLFDADGKPLIPPPP